MKTLLAFLVFLLLAACAPVASGSTPVSTPIHLIEPQITFDVEPGIILNELDRHDEPIDFTLESVYGSPNEPIRVRSVDYRDGNFRVIVKIGDTEAFKEASYGNCIFAHVTYEEVWVEEGIVYPSQANFTVCSVNYFRFNR